MPNHRATVRAELTPVSKHHCHCVLGLSVLGSAEL